MNKTFKKILSVCCTVVTTLTATLFRSTEVRADNDYKIVFIGESGVGKTQLVNRIKGDQFSETYQQIIGIRLTMASAGEANYLRLVDTTGNNTFQRAHGVNYNDAALIILCCDLERLPPKLGDFSTPTSGTNILLCITKIDQATQDVPRNNDTNLQQEISKKLLEFRNANGEYDTILPQVLVTSAKYDKYQICAPKNYDSTKYKNIHPNLAKNLVHLCRGQETAQHTVNSDSTAHNNQKDSEENTHNEKKSHMGYWSKLIALLVSSGLLAVFGYYGHDRYKKKKAVNHPTGKYIQNEKKEIKKLLNN